MDKSRKNRRGALRSAVPYLTAGLAACAVMLIIYAVNRIFPFGANTVVCEDMVQQTIPNYTQFWDWLHHPSSRSLLFNWNTAAGVEVMTSGFYIFKPWDILFTLVVPRAHITEGIPFLLMFKVAMCSVTMTFFLRKRFRLSAPWVFTLSMAYAFSAFNLIYYTNMSWLDMAFLFPLLIAAALRMADTGKWLPYCLLLAYISVLSVYSTYMVCMFLLLIGFLYLAFMYPKERRKATIVRFGLSSVLALLISAAMNVPYIHYIMGSTRRTIKEKSTLFETLKSIFTNSTTYSSAKLQVVFLCSGLLFAFLVLIIADFKKHKKQTLFFTLGAAILILPAFVESINLLWHIGSYVSFPMRYVYELVFFGITCAAWCIQNTDGVIHILKGRPVNIIFGVISAAAAAGGIYLLVTRVYTDNFAASGLKYRYILREDATTYILLSFLLMAVAYILALYLKNKKLSWSIITVFLAVETGLLGYTVYGVGADNKTRNSMYQTDYIAESHIMRGQLPQENDHLSRIKDHDLHLNSNYPLLLDFPAMSNFTHLVSSDMTDAMENLGYSQIYTRVVDSTGTPLSDALLNMKYTFAEGDLNDTEYTYLSEFGTCGLYADNFTLPAGLIVNSDFMNVDVFSGDAFTNTNELYRALSGSDEDIFEFDEELFDTATGDYTKTVHVEGTRHLYLWIDIDSASTATRGSVSVIIDGKRADLTYFNSTANYYYPNNFWNELIDCGVRTDEDVQIDLLSVKNVGTVPVVTGLFDDSKLAALCEMKKNSHGELTTGNRSLTATAVNEGAEDAWIYLPVAYDDGWSCRLNGSACAIDPALGGFMAVQLAPGENTIEMKYTPYGLKTGILITLFAILATAALYIVSRKRPLDPEADTVILRIIDKIYYVGMFAVFAVMYLLTTAYTIYANVF